MTTNRLSREEIENILTNTDYGKIYIEFINNRLTKPYAKQLKQEHGYEIHHIVPRAYGGMDIKDNKLKLTTCDHIMAHYYLALATNNVFMFQGFNCIVGRVYDDISELEKIQLNELKHWAEIRDKARLRCFSDEARETISRKAIDRWEKFRETGRIDEIKQNISNTTKEGMKNSIKAQIKTRVNLGCKKYYNESEDKEMNWYPGMPEPDPKLWKRGRRPNSKESREKLSKTLKENKKNFYHNDELKINTTFGIHDKIPEGWIKGQKSEYMGNSTKKRQKERKDTLSKLIKESI